MDKITQLIATLSARELYAVRKYYALRSNAESSLRKQLLELVISKPGISDIESAAFFNKKPSDTSFSMLKRRLKDDIVKIIVWEQRATKFKSKYFKARFECRLLIAEAEILVGRGANLLAIEHLYKARKLAETYELTNEAIIINEQLITFVAIREGFNTYSKFAENSLLQFKVIQDKFKAQDYLRQLTIPNLFQTNKEWNYLEKASAANEELRILSEQTNSVEIRFWYLRSEVFFNHLRKDYEQAFHYALQFLQLIEDSKVVWSEDNMGGANMQLAMISIFRGEHALAAGYAEKATNFFTRGSTNYVNAAEVMFQSLFHREQWTQAADILHEIQQNKNVAKNHMLRSKWTFFEAQLLFGQKKWSESLAILQQQTELFNDKSGWRLGIKILEMMCIVEMENDDWLDFRIESFRKLLSDLRKENIARPKLIFQIFKQYIRSGYSWKDAASKLPEHIDLLAGGVNEHYWDAMGYEMTRFDTWLKKKIPAKSLKN
jgi:hypothetical protein